MSNLSRVYESNTFVLMPIRRGFVDGLSAITDAAGSEAFDRYATSPTPKEADTKAIAADWKAVGNDLMVAYEWGRQEIADAK